MAGRMLSQHAAGVHRIAYTCSTKQKMVTNTKRARGVEAYQNGLAAEDIVCQKLRGAGWNVLLQRARTRRGEIDIVAQNTAGCSRELIGYSIQKVVSGSRMPSAKQSTLAV